VLALPRWYDDNGPWKPPPPEPNVPLTPLHPDIVTVVPYGPQIRIEQVREVRRVAQFPPVEAPLRVIIIDPAEAMNEAAANALLKTLEEPPAHTRFILLSHSPSSLLVTIRSRCQRLDFQPLAEAQVASVVAREQPDASPEARMTAVRVAQGSPRLAIQLVSDPVLAAWMPLAARLCRLDPARPALALVLAAEMAELGAPGTLFELLVRLLRDALMLLVHQGATDSPAEPPFHAPIADELAHYARRQSVDGLLHRVAIAEDTRLAVETFNTPLRLGLERLLLEIAAPAGQERAHPFVDRRAVL
jgi:DNA polymerase-3 subunit delta'